MPGLISHNEKEGRFRCQTTIYIQRKSQQNGTQWAHLKANHLKIHSCFSHRWEEMKHLKTTADLCAAMTAHLSLSNIGMW